MAKQTYSELLKDPRWQKKRLEALQAAEWACQDCGCDERTLHVHHLRYGSTPWDVELRDLRTLCETCHDTRHATLHNLTKEILPYLDKLDLERVAGYAITLVAIEQQGFISGYNPYSAVGIEDALDPERRKEVSSKLMVGTTLTYQDLTGDVQ